MKLILAMSVAAALLGGCVVVPAGHGYRGDGDWRADRHDRYDRYDRYDGDRHSDGRGWRDSDDRGR